MSSFGGDSSTTGCPAGMPLHRLFDPPCRVAGSRTASKIHCHAQLHWSEVSSLEQLTMPEAPPRNHLKNCSGVPLEDSLEESKYKQAINGPAYPKESAGIHGKLRETSPWFEETTEGLRLSGVAQASPAHKRHVSVVAKLMGLDCFLESVGLSGTCDTSRRPEPEPNSPVCGAVHDSVAKTVSDSLFPKGPTLGKQKEGVANLEPLKLPVSKPVVNLAKQEKSMQSVCSEIERSCKDINFVYIENDLTSRKQILESVGRKRHLETQRIEECLAIPAIPEEYKVKHGVSSPKEEFDHVMIIEPLKHPDNDSVQRAGRFYEEDGVPLQQSSPVSVLDVFESIPDPPSPVLQTRSSLAEHCDRRHKSINQDNITLEIIRKKLQNVGLLVQKLERLCSTQGAETSDYVAQLCECEIPSPAQRYICEILISSGILLRDFSSGLSTFQLHPSGHPIDTGLFRVLEQREKKRNGAVDEEDASWRRITFDYVNEIIGRKFADLGNAKGKLSKETLSAQKLLRDLCCEIILMEAKMVIPSRDPDSDSFCCLKSILQDDMRKCKDKWTGFHVDKYELIIDLEQMIFEGLMDEIMFGERVGLRKISIWCASYIGS